MKIISTGGAGGIRTLGTVTRTHAFQAGAFSHSATAPSIVLMTASETFVNIRIFNLLAFRQKLWQPVFTGRDTNRMIEFKLKKRRSFDAGHRPKYLVLADESAEFDRALYFAVRRAARNKAAVIALYVIKPSTDQEWLGVGDIMQAEAEEKAEQLLAKIADRAVEIANIRPECVIRTGAKIDEILGLIAGDEDISLMFLATGTQTDEPGPVVSLMMGKGGIAFNIPVTIVPGNLKDEEIEALT